MFYISLFFILLLNSIIYVNLLEIELPRTIKTNETYLRNVLKNIMIPRVVGTQTHEQVKDYILNELNEIGFQTETNEFFANVPIFGNIKFTNIIGKYGTGFSKYMTLACHYDSKYFANNTNFVAAIDSAVSCSLILDTAREIFSYLRNGTNYGLMLIFFDGEEAILDWTAQDSIYGSRHLANEMSKQNNGNKYVGLQQIKVLVLLDLIGAEGMKIPNFVYNAKGLHKLIYSIEQQLFGRNNIFQNFMSFALIDDDHRPFMLKGVPVLHLIPMPFPKQWHTLNDNDKNLHWPTILNFEKLFKIFTLQFLLS